MGLFDSLGGLVASQGGQTDQTTTTDTRNVLFEKGEFAAPEIGHLLRGDTERLAETQIGRGILAMFEQAQEDPADLSGEALSRVSNAAMGGEANPLAVAAAASEAEASGQQAEDAQRQMDQSGVMPLTQTAQQSQQTRASRMHLTLGRSQNTLTSAGPSAFDRFLATAGMFLGSMKPGEDKDDQQSVSTGTTDTVGSYYSDPVTFQGSGFNYYGDEPPDYFGHGAAPVAGAYSTTPDF